MSFVTHIYKPTPKSLVQRKWCKFSRILNSSVIPQPSENVAEFSQKIGLSYPPHPTPHCLHSPLLPSGQKFGRVTQKKLLERSKFLRPNLSKFSGKKPQNLNFRGTKLFNTVAEFFIKLAEKFCQELQHWRMLCNGG